MPWTAHHRWVFPNFRLVLSETRTPDERGVGGFARRRYSEGLHVAFSNASWIPVQFAVSFWRAEARVCPEFTFGGTLAGHESDEVHLFDHPGLTLPDLGTRTSGDLFVQWVGWFEVYASAPMQVSAWNEVWEKPASETSGRGFVRTLDQFEAAMPRGDHLDFPDEPGRPSVVWRTQRVPTPGPTPGVFPENSRCASLRESIQTLREEIGDLQREMSTAPPNAKARIAGRIRALSAQLDTSVGEARALGCWIP